MPARHLPPLTSQGASVSHYPDPSRNDRQGYDEGKGYTRQRESQYSGGGVAFAQADSTSAVQVHLPAIRTSPSASSKDARSAGDAGKQQRTLAMSPDTTLKMYMHKLSTYEHSEIYNYPSIYFIGQNANKRSGVAGSANNDGYDDDQGTYIQTPHDHIAYRYEVLKVIGKGSFGQVVKAYDHKTQQNVALKMVRNEKRFHRQAQEEIRILEHLKKCDKDNAANVVHLCEHFSFRNHICITFELLSFNLYELIKKNKFQVGFFVEFILFGSIYFLLYYSLF